MKSDKTISKLNRNKKKRQVKDAKRLLNKTYKGLIYDKLGDQGRDLYRQGKSVHGNNRKRMMVGIASAVISTASSQLAGKGKTVFGRYIKNYGTLKMTSGDIAALSLSGAAIMTSLTVDAKSNYENRRIRAYYGHKQV